PPDKRPHKPPAPAAVWLAPTTTPHPTPARHRRLRAAVIGPPPRPRPRVTRERPARAPRLAACIRSRVVRASDVRWRGEVEQVAAAQAASRRLVLSMFARS